MSIKLSFGQELFPLSPADTCELCQHELCYVVCNMAERTKFSSAIFFHQNNSSSVCICHKSSDKITLKIAILWIQKGKIV